MSYKMLSVSLRSVHDNVRIHVLFEKLTATVVLNFTRCHLIKTIDNRHVITIHIQYTSFEINFNMDLNYCLSLYSICCIIQLVIIFNIFKLHPS